ncbi:MAG: ATP-binding protein [Sulfurospirillaceae bacterium]|nr:ATP-binding protein [Sulfurospirillaceae bacterium]
MKIAIASGKGGTGKTTLSVNLASLLAQKNSVFLVDLDVEEPNAKLFLGGELLSEESKYKMIPKWSEESCTFCQKCVEVCNYHALLGIANEILVFPNLCHSCYACSELCPTQSLPMFAQKMGTARHYVMPDMELIEGELDLGEEQAVSLISQTKTYVEKLLLKDTIAIYDCPPGTSCPVIEAVKDVDFVILVTEPTPFGLNDLKLAVETIRVLKKPFGVVVNRYDAQDDRVFAYCESENIEILAKIPNDKALAVLYSKGALIYHSSKSVKCELEKISCFLKSLTCKERA